MLPASLASPIPHPPSLRVEFGAQSRFCWSALTEQTGNEAIAVIASVLDEDFVGVIAGDHYTGDKYSRNRSLQRRRVVRRNSGLRIDGYAGFTQQIEAWRETRHHVYTICFQSLLTALRRQQHFVRIDLLDATIPTNMNLSFLHAIGEVGQHPRLDFLVEARTEVDESCPRT